MLTLEQHRVRSTGVGASEVGAIIGVDSYKTGLDVWMDKKGLGTKMPDSIASRLGSFNEPFITELYVEAKELAPESVVGDCPTQRHPVHEFALATPDRIVYPQGSSYLYDRYLLELKHRSRFTISGFGEPGTDEVPPTILCQVQWQMLVTNDERADVAVLVDRDEFRCYTVRRDDALITELVERVGDFWHNNVLADVAPEITSPRSAERWLRYRHAKHLSEQILEATPEQAALLAEYAVATATAAQVEDKQKALQNLIKLAIGDAAGIAAESVGKVTWKAGKDSEKTDWKELARSLSPTPEQIAQFTTTQAGSRRFLFTPTK